jgi:hypothetical protein
MHRLAYFNRGLMAAMIADLTGAFRYQTSRTPIMRWMWITSDFACSAHINHSGAASVVIGRW